MLRLPEGANPVSLGEGVTPIVPTPDGRSWLKLDFLNPTGSFKDRGASVLVTGLKAWGVEEVAEDSSGNAGVALSAYAKAAGIKCKIFVPQGASPGKVAALNRFGAEVVFCSTRQEAAERVMDAVRSGTYYASHTWHPLYLQGTKTVAYELAEQFSWEIDDRWSVFIPVGNGDLLLGIHLGFQELLASACCQGYASLDWGSSPCVCTDFRCCSQLDLTAEQNCR
jgi:threonine synthase